MKVQLKKGLLDICVLAALVEEDSYGYKLIQDTQPIVEMSESTLYPILRRLEDSDFLKSYQQEHGGRLRKYYQITNKGIQHVKSFMLEWKSIVQVYDYIKGKINNE